LNGNGSTVTSTDAGAATGFIYAADAMAANAGASEYSAAVIDILDYQGTKNKTTRSLYGLHDANDKRIRLSSGLWMNTTAISSITISAASGNFTTASRFSLYGIK
jgi:hypothetical protein